MRLRSSALALVASTIFLGAAPAIADDAGANYYPVKIGTRLSYRVTTPNGSKDVTTEAARTEKVGDDTCTAMVLKDTDGKQLGAEDILVRADGVYRAAYGSAQVTPPLCILKLPVKKGQSWKVASAVMGANMTGTYTIDDIGQEVTVPAGKFKCVVVTIDDLSVNGQKIGSVKTFFADGVGVVKLVTKLNGVAMTQELTKFEPVADAKSAGQDPWACVREGSSWETVTTTHMVIAGNVSDNTSTMKCTITRKTADSVTMKTDTTMTLGGTPNTTSNDSTIPLKAQADSTEQDVTVPAGTFHCVYTKNDSGGATTETWVSKDGGYLVQAKNTNGGKMTVSQLTRLEDAPGVQVKAGTYDCKHMVVETKDDAGKSTVILDYWMSSKNLLPPGCYVKMVMRLPNPSMQMTSTTELSRAPS